jgi:signal recognition particle GTPase
MSRSLENVIRALQMERARQRGRFQEAERARSQVEADLRAIDDRLAAAQRACADFDVQTRMISDRAADFLGRRRSSLSELRDRVETEAVAPAREHLVEANVRVRTVERLLERRREERRHRWALDEQRTTDEAAARRHRRDVSF